jgi:hypothetical protein
MTEKPRIFCITEELCILWCNRRSTYILTQQKYVYLCITKELATFCYNRKTMYTLLYHKNHVYLGITEELPDDLGMIHPVVC